MLNAIARSTKYQMKIHNKTTAASNYNNHWKHYFLNIAFSTKSANNNNSFNLLEKFAFSSIFLFATYNFTQFVTDNPKALQVAIETAKNSEDLKKALGGGELESPFYKRIFWGGSVKNGKVQIDVPVVCKNTGKEAIIKGKGLQDAYGKNEIWFYSLFAELNENGDKIDLIVLSEEEENEGKVTKTNVNSIERQQEKINKLQNKINQLEKNVRDI